MRTLCVGIVVVLAAFVAEAALWSNPARGWVAEAEASMAMGARAEEDGDSMRAYEHYNRAQNLLRRSMTEKPSFRSEYVQAKDTECQERLNFLDPHAQNAIEGMVTKEAEQYEEKPITAARPVTGAENKPERSQPAPQADSSREIPTEEDVMLSQEIQSLLAKGKATEAVLRLESIIEEAGDQATLTQHLLLAQALMARRNYVRAEQIIFPLAEQFRDNPSVLLMASGVAVVKGEPMIALRMLDAIVREHPTFADAYVNLAYLRLAMDPKENRQEAIIYYREALRLGAVRDKRLEQELDITVQEKELKQ